MDDSNTRWNSRISFIFAASAAAIGLGNIWRFPYMAGENGGGAFVLIYLACVVILGVPLLVAEITMGRLGRKNPAQSMADLAIQSNRSHLWGWVGGLTILAGYLILTYYVVIVGWVLDYVFRAAIGQFAHATEASSVKCFTELQNSHWEMLLTDTIVILGAMSINIFGIKKGLERAVMFMFPALLLLMFLLLGYAMTTGGFNQAIDFLFKPDLSEVSSTTILLALGQAFFSLNIAMGVTIMFSAYLPGKTPVTSSAIFVAIADTGFALLAGLIIFPIVFSFHLKPGAGPSLIFQTLPIAFAQMPAGSLIATLFFLMLFFAAFSSVIALLEPAICWLMQTWRCTRARAVMITGVTCWVFSLGAIGSFSAHEHFLLFGVTLFQAIDFLTASIMLPIGGILIAIFCGWFLAKKLIHDELHWKINFWYHVWQIILRYFAPLAILFILLTSFGII